MHENHSLNTIVRYTMKKILLISSLLAATFAATPVVEASDNKSLRICEYVSVNDNKRLRKFLKQNKLKIRTVFKNIKCNGQNLLVFAANSNSLDVGEFIIKKISKKTVAANVEAITAKSAHLAAIANKRIAD